jgi:hypothetical protein
MPLDVDRLRAEAFTPFSGAVTSAVPNIHPTGLGLIEIVTGPGLVGFKLNGTLRWLIDVKFFAGKPVLNLNQVQDGLQVELTGARFPGTNLSADFVCELRKTNRPDTRMNLSMTLGGFHARLIFERWLAGSQHAESPVTLNDTVCQLGASGKVTMEGPAEAIFSPNWMLNFAAPTIATIITGPSSQLASDELTLRLLTSQDASVVSTPKSKRTHLTMLRGSHDWDLKPVPTLLAIGSLTAQKDLFDRIDIEAGETTSDDVDHVLLAQSFSEDKLTLQLGGELKDLDDNPFTLELVRPRYAIDFEADHAVLLSHFGQKPKWLSVQGFALQVGDVWGPAPFEMEMTGGLVTALRCEPRFLQACAPLKGDAVARPLPLDGKRLNFVAIPDTKPGWGVLAAPDVVGKPKLSLPDFAVSVLRRDDLLSLEFLFFNVALEAGQGTPPRLVKIDSGKDAFFATRFNAPQNIAERVFFEDADNTDPPTSPPVSALAAGPSRLVFRLAANVTSLGYTLDSLLHWENFDPSLAPVAVSPDPPEAISGEQQPLIREPNLSETAIEAPWHLIISPNSTGGWKHETTAVTHLNRTELWHTRLGVRKSIDGSSPLVDEQDESTRKIRAIWSPDYQSGPPPPSGGGPFRMSLDNRDRNQIVARSSNYFLSGQPPRAIDVNQLMLSALGAWMNVRGHWDDPGGLFNIEEWLHRAAMGRDNYVRVVEAGYLLPFGHRASLIKVTERKFQKNSSGHTTAYLRQREFIVVKEPEKDYGYLVTAVPQKRGRDFPYTSVGITTLVTPNLDVNNGLHFFPKVGGFEFLFHIVGRDRDGQLSEFTAPLLFAADSQDYLALAIADYTNASLLLRKRDLLGQSIAYAASSKPGDTSLNTSTLTFNVASLPNPSQQQHQPPFYPILDPNGAADVVIPAVQQLTGINATVPIKLYQNYVDSDFKEGGIFVELLNGGLEAKFSSSDRSGGVATPSMNVAALSRTFGTVGGASSTLDNFENGTFDPKDYFGTIADAKLLGFIPLTDVIEKVLNIAGNTAKVPKVLTNRMPDAIITSLAWKPMAKNWTAPGGFASVTFLAPDNPEHGEHLELDVTIRKPLVGGGPPEATVAGHMRNFKIDLFNVIGIHFKVLDFTSTSGKKLDTSAEMGEIEFEGDLRFLNELQKYIPSSGFRDPPSVNVTSTGVTVGYSQGIPNIGVGVFSLENIRLGAALELPFISQPVRFRFAFSEREHPFLISVSMLGGGGFFGLAIGPEGVEMLEAALEFGANVSINLVVASGNLHIMAGVYLKLEPSNNASQLTGYLRAGGSAEVLGLITISIEFYFGFTYYFEEHKIAGEASVDVEVDVLFFSATVEVKMRREFSDPEVSFSDLMSSSDWDDYCEAFAT